MTGFMTRLMGNTVLSRSDAARCARRRRQRAVAFVAMQVLEERRLLTGDPPLAVDDAYEVPEDQQLFVPAPGVLANDTDPEDDTLSAAIVDHPQNGTIEVLGTDGSFYYTPNLNFHGTDTFTYRANDGSGDSNIATVTITVTPVNDIPVAQNDAYTVQEDGSLVVDAAAGVLVNDTDADGDTLTAIKASGPSHGWLTLNDDGSFTYTPHPDFYGTDSFTYYASDGTDQSAVATVTINVLAVNDLPVANDDSYQMLQGQTLNIIAPGVLENDTDAEASPLSAILAQTAAHGTLVLNIDGSFTYTPAPAFSGTDTFTYRASDGIEEGNAATVTITVVATNQAPTAVDDVYQTLEDTPLTVDAPGVLANDTDPESDPLTAVLVAGPQRGTLTLNADGSFIYTPAPNFNGTDSFTYQAADAIGPGNTATVVITVVSVNDVPVAADDAYVVGMNTALTIAAPGVLANDTDADGNDLTAVLVTGPQNGTLTLEPDGYFIYTPAPGFAGIDTFTYQASDGIAASNTATVTITVNASPVAVDDAYQVLEDNVLTIAAPGVLANDTDAEGDPITAVLVAAPQHGTFVLNADGSFTYVPAPNFNGTDSFTYRAADALSAGSTATVVITVTPVNDLPVAADDAYSVAVNGTLTVAAPGVLGNDSDIDGDALVPSVVAGPQHGQLTLNADGSFEYIPDADYHGLDSFTYQVSDGTDMSNVATVTIAVNSLPWAGDDAYDTLEDVPLTVPAPGVLANDIDADGDALTVVLVAGPQHGTLTLNNDGSFIYTPALNFNGTDSFTYLLNDGFGDSNTATVTITVTSVNDVPVAADDSYVIRPDTTLTVAAPGVLGNDSDADGDELTVALVAGPQHGTLTLNPDGSFEYVPAPGYIGADSFTYQASDGTATSAIATVTITVNAAPVAADDVYETLEDTVLTMAAPGVLANDIDADGDPLTAVLVDGPQHGVVVFAADGSFMYTPAANFNGTDSFTYRAADALGSGNTATVTITVMPANDLPVAADDSYTTSTNTPLTVAAPGVLGNDSDIDGDALSAVLVAGPQHGTLTLNSDGSFEYIPAAGFFGLDSFTYQAFDGTGASGTATVTIRVNAVPAAANDAYNTAHNVPLVVGGPGGVLANDTDADGDALTAVLVTPPTQGTLSLNPSGAFTYIPNAGFSGIDSFTYAATDGLSQSSPATVTITVAPPVNQAPTAQSFQVLRAPGARASMNLAARATDPDGDALTFVVLTAPRYGQVDVNPTTGLAQYIPDARYLGRDSFVYQVSDGKGGTATGTVTINVAGAGLVPRAGAPKVRDLVVIGTAGNDTIQFYRSLTVKNGVKVKFNGALKGTFVVSGRIIAKGLAGNDVITAKGLNFAAAFYGGTGNDKLIGPASPSRLEGGPGKDTLLGGSGRDTLIQ